MVMAIDISITPLTLVPADGPASHSLANEQARKPRTLTLTLFRNDKMVDLIGTAQDALRYVRARRTPSPRARV